MFGWLGWRINKISQFFTSIHLNAIYRNERNMNVAKQDLSCVVPCGEGGLINTNYLQSGMMQGMKLRTVRLLSNFGWDHPGSQVHL